MVVFDNSNIPELKYDKCVKECTCGHHWQLGDKLIKEELSYKYLGIELDKKLALGSLRVG